MTSLCSFRSPLPSISLKTSALQRDLPDRTDAAMLHAAREDGGGGGPVGVRHPGGKSGVYLRPSRGFDPGSDGGGVLRRGGRPRAAGSWTFGCIWAPHMSEGRSIGRPSALYVCSVAGAMLFVVVVVDRTLAFDYVFLLLIFFVGCCCCCCCCFEYFPLFSIFRSTVLPIWIFKVDFWIRC